jgi:hypothetical protein
VGASSWSYVEPWAGSAEGTFAALQAKEFVRIFSTWPEEHRPADIAELWSGDELDEQTWAGFMCAQGTHTILDIQEFIPTEVDFDSLPEGATMRLVPIVEVVEAFGHGRPSRAEFERLSRRSSLFEDDGRGTGRCVVLHEGGIPTAVAFWGHSGD